MPAIAQYHHHHYHHIHRRQYGNCKCHDNYIDITIRCESKLNCVWVGFRYTAIASVSLELSVQQYEPTNQTIQFEIVCDVSTHSICLQTVVLCDNLQYCSIKYISFWFERDVNNNKRFNRKIHVIFFFCFRISTIEKSINCEIKKRQMTK